MKKELIEKIKKAKAESWRKALELAENKSPFPFTDIDALCKNAHFAIESLQWPKGSPGRNVAERDATEYGWIMFRLVENNDSGQLRRLADALDQRKKHQPGLDQSGHIRAILIALDGMGRSHIDADKIRTIPVAKPEDIPKGLHGCLGVDGWFYTDPASVVRVYTKIT